MQELAVQYESKGLQILCFPCNQFLSQEPWKEPEIKKWVDEKWPKLNPVLFTKIDVNGDNTHKVYKFLKSCFPGDINWNFATKFVIGADGIPVQRYDKNQKWEDIEKCIQQQLKTGVVEDITGADDKKNDEIDNKDENVEENPNDKVLLTKTEYVYKSIDKENNKITCLDAEFNDIIFDLNAENKELMDKIHKVIKDGQEQKKDVQIVVSVLKKDNKETQTVSDVKINI